MTHFDVSALGARVRIAPDEGVTPAFLERVRAAWCDAMLEPAQEADTSVILSSQGAEDSILEQISVDVTLAALHYRRGELLMFHAAGVADPTGQVIAFVGPSGRGKTTLSRHLAQTYGYVSDETVAIDSSLTVFPYRKPLSVIREGQPKDQVAPSVFGLQPLPAAPLALRALVVLDRADDPCEPRIERMLFTDAVQEVLPQMSYFPELEAPFAQLATVVEAVGGVLKLTYSEATEVLPVIRAVFDGNVAPADSGPGERLVACEPHPSADLRIGAIDDAFDTGDEVVVMANRVVHVLDGIAPEIWRGLSAGQGLAQVTESVVEVFGAPPEGDPTELVRAAISELAAKGLVDEPEDA